MLAVYVDLSKANASVRLDLLEFLLEGSGLPSQVWRPMLAKEPCYVQLCCKDQVLGGRPRRLGSRGHEGPGRVGQSHPLL